jgi:site-specific recombinase XerD
MSSDDFEPIDPSTAQEMYLKQKASHCVERTVRSHRYRTNYFVEWCDEIGLDNLNNLTGRHLHEYRLWRDEQSDLNRVSMQTQLCTIRVFLKYCASIEAVDSDLPEKIILPTVSSEEIRRDELLEADRAEDILGYLTKYQYASREHVLLAMLWETGARIGGIRSLDVSDVNLSDRFLAFRHRPSEGTTLKNGNGGNRLAAITPDLEQLLRDYINDTRKAYTDEFGRDPLLTSRFGRLSRASMRRIIYNLTAPCFLEQECPGCTENADAKCPEAVSPHGVRRGAVTHYLSNDVPVEIVGDRMDVSRRVLDKHYDQRSEEVKLNQRRSYLDNL